MAKEKVLVYALRLGALVVIAGAWVYATGPGHVAELVLPAPRAVGGELLGALGGVTLWKSVLVTVLEIAVAACIAAVCGIAYGFWGARGRTQRKVLESLATWGYMTPFVLFYPLFILVFGVGPASKVAFAALASFFPIAYASLRAFSNVSPRYVQMARAFGASGMQLDTMVKVPASLALVRAGLRIGIATSMIMVILGEMLGSTEGLGYLVANSSQTLATTQEYAFIVCVLVLALLVQVVLARGLSRRGEES